MFDSVLDTTDTLIKTYILQLLETSKLNAVFNYQRKRSLELQNDFFARKFRNKSRNVHRKCKTDSYNCERLSATGPKCFKSENVSKIHMYKGKILNIFILDNLWYLVCKK